MLSLVETSYPADQDSELLEDGDFCGRQPRKISVLECVHDGSIPSAAYYESGTSTLYNVQSSAAESASIRSSSSPESDKQTQQQSSSMRNESDYGATTGDCSNGAGSSSNSSAHGNGIHVCPGGTEKVSRTNLYIKGLPDSFSDEKLWNLPPDQNQIKSVKAATDDDGKCRGYGFIDFINETAANEALKHIKETYPAFTIKFAKENEKDKTNLYVTHLPKSWTTKDSDQLKSVFEQFGPIQSAFVMMERSTNRTTGVGFVRFANERDALAALDSIKNNPIILPECTEPVEAKFADKHNPDTRRRRYPAAAAAAAAAAASVLQASSVSNLLGYPLTLTHPGSHVGTTDQLAAFLNGGGGGGLGVHPTTAAAAQRLAQGLLATPVPGKLSTSVSTAGGMADFTGLSNPGSNPGVATESQLNAFATALATAALLGGANSSLRSNLAAANGGSGGAGGAGGGPTGSFNPIQLNSAGLLSTTPLSLMTNQATAGADPNLLDPGLYGCSIYGNDYYRQSQQQQQQQQQQQLAAAVAAMNSVSSNGSLYSPVPDLSPFVGYPNGLLSSHQAAAASLNGSVTVATCLAPSGHGLGPIYSAQANGLLHAPNPALTDPLGLVGGSRPTQAVHSWLLPNPMLKSGCSADPTIPIAHQAAVLSGNHNSVGMSPFDRNCKHVQLFI